VDIDICRVWGGVGISATLVSYNNTTRRNNPQNQDFYLHRRENLKSRKWQLFNQFGAIFLSWGLSEPHSLRSSSTGSPCKPVNTIRPISYLKTRDSEVEFNAICYQSYAVDRHQRLFIVCALSVSHLFPDKGIKYRHTEWAWTRVLIIKFSLSVRNVAWRQPLTLSKRIRLAANTDKSTCISNEAISET